MTYGGGSLSLSLFSDQPDLLLDFEGLLINKSIFRGEPHGENFSLYVEVSSSRATSISRSHILVMI